MMIGLSVSQCLKYSDKKNLSKLSFHLDTSCVCKNIRVVQTLETYICFVYVASREIVSVFDKYMDGKFLFVKNKTFSLLMEDQITY